MQPAPPIEFAFLEDGAQSADGTAALLAGFIGEARSTLEIAIYDLRLAGPPAELLLAAVKAAAARGVMVRIVFNQDHPKKRPVPPPSEVDWDLVKQNEHLVRFASALTKFRRAQPTVRRELFLTGKPLSRVPVRLPQSRTRRPLWSL